MRQSIPFHTIYKIHFLVFSLIRYSSDSKSLLSKIKCLGVFFAMLHKNAVIQKEIPFTLLLVYFMWKLSLSLHDFTAYWFSLSHCPTEFKRNDASSYLIYREGMGLYINV